MGNTQAVIGAVYGDEGKGRLVDYLASLTPTLVVRHNGGAQAGHTVVTPEGLRHVFHHFGSGTFVGSPTYLSRFFIVNPLIWSQEASVLPLIPRVMVSPEAAESNRLRLLISTTSSFFAPLRYLVSTDAVIFNVSDIPTN